MQKLTLREMLFSHCVINVYADDVQNKVTQTTRMLSDIVTRTDIVTQSYVSYARRPLKRNENFHSDYGCIHYHKHYYNPKLIYKYVKHDIIFCNQFHLCT